MSTDPAWIAVLVAFIGATVTYVYSRRSEQEKQRWTARTQAYVDYVAAITRSSWTSSAGGSGFEELSATIDNAKYRICIYGSKGVIEALVAFEGVATSTEPTAGQREFLNVCSEMRRDSAGRNEEVDIAQLQRAFWPTHGPHVPPTR